MRVHLDLTSCGYLILGEWDDETTKHKHNDTNEHCYLENFAILNLVRGDGERVCVCGERGGAGNYCDLVFLIIFAGLL